MHFATMQILAWLSVTMILFLAHGEELGGEAQRV